MIGIPYFLPTGPVCMDDQIHMLMARAGATGAPATASAPAPATAPGPFAARNAANDVHVVKHGSGWAVKVEHTAGYAALLPTQFEAIAAGAAQARSGKVQLIVHGADGRFRDVRNYR
jgi:hypothetical protein